jgi:hypothetical protein
VWAVGAHDSHTPALLVGPPRCQRLALDPRCMHTIGDRRPGGARCGQWETIMMTRTHPVATLHPHSFGFRLRVSEGRIESDALASPRNCASACANLNHHNPS